MIIDAMFPVHGEMIPTGEAVVSAQGIEPAMLVALEPCNCRLQMVD